MPLNGSTNVSTEGGCKPTKVVVVETYRQAWQLVRIAQTRYLQMGCKRIRMMLELFCKITNLRSASTFPF